jgi:hypothetical protein
MMRRVNTAFAHFVEAEPPDAPLAFFCECSSEACFSVVWLTVAGYEARVAADDEWIVVAGHAGSARDGEPAGAAASRSWRIPQLKLTHGARPSRA